MRIYSKKAFALGPGAKPHSDVIEQIVTVPGAFQDIPDEYANDNMFKLALKAGDITVIDVKPSVPVDFVEQTSEHEEKEVDKDPYHEFKEKLTLANSDEVKKLAEEYGAKFVEDDKLKENKKRVYEAYKIKMADSSEANSEEE